MSIFSQMSKMAQEYHAVNLAQGFPNFPTDPQLKNLVKKAIDDGYNQYGPLNGIPELREEISKKIYKLHRKNYDPASEVLVTNGATQALYLAITAFIHPGDEVIILKPAYDSYEPAVKLCGGIPVPVQLKGKNYQLDIAEVKKKISSRTRMLIFNNPHNPSGSVVSKEDLKQLEGLLKDTNILLLSDEVYEHLVYDDHSHVSVSALPGLSERSIVCASFGKTFHNTGWKIGYAVAPEILMEELLKVMEVNVFCVHHPSQRAFSEYLKNPEHYLRLPEFFQRKRDFFLSFLEGTKFQFEPAEGTYFQLLNYSEISDEPDVEFAQRLVKEYALAGIPVSVFNDKGLDFRQLRFCFAKTEQTLEKAGKILRQISERG